MSNANIHGVDHNSNYNNNYNNQYSSGQEGLFNRSNYKGDPRAQSIISYLKEAICPFFTFKSFSFIIIVVNIIIFIFFLLQMILWNFLGIYMVLALERNQNKFIVG